MSESCIVCAILSRCALQKLDGEQLWTMNKVQLAMICMLERMHRVTRKVRITDKKIKNNLSKNWNWRKKNQRKMF